MDSTVRETHTVGRWTVELRTQPDIPAWLNVYANYAATGDSSRSQQPSVFPKNGKVAWDMPAAIPAYVKRWVAKHGPRLLEVGRVLLILDGATVPVSGAVNVKTCFECGRSWDDARISAITPVPSARCPFEYAHTYRGGSE
jgi:hypothetical protein